VDFIRQIFLGSVFILQEARAREEGIENLGDIFH